MKAGLELGPTKSCSTGSPMSALRPASTTSISGQTIQNIQQSRASSFFARGRETEFVFAVFPHNEHNGGASWLISRSHRFAVKLCNIASPDKTLYSLSHRFIDAMRNVMDPRIDSDIQRAIVARAGDILSQYGRGRLLKAMAEMTRVVRCPTKPN